jgi:hypothetical protein
LIDKGAFLEMTWEKITILCFDRMDMKLMGPKVVHHSFELCVNTLTRG